MKQLFFKAYSTFLLLLVAIGAYSQPLKAQTRTLRYWFDGDVSTLRQDPFGFGQGDEPEIILNTAGLSDGVHTISTQAQRADGTYTPVASALFIKSNYRQGANGSGRIYAWIGDPNHTLPIIHDIGEQQGLIDISFLIGGGMIPRGLKTFYLQYVSSEGMASPMVSALFCHLPHGAKVERIEIWVDKPDGAPLFSQKVERKEGENILLLDLSVEMAQQSLTPGVHRFYTRYTRADGGQSPLESAYFLKAPIDFKKDPIKAVRYWFDDNMRTAREYAFEAPCAPGAMQEILLSTHHIPKGKHKISLASVTEKGILGQPTTDSVEVMYGFPSSVRIQSLFPDPNALLPEGVMEGGVEFLYYRVADTLKRPVEGASLLYSLDVEGRKYMFQTAPSDSTGIVTIEVPTKTWGEQWKAIGSSEKVYIPVGKTAKVQLSKVTFEGYDTPIEIVHNDFKEHKVRCFPLLSRSFTLDVKLGAKGKVGVDVGVGSGEVSATLKGGFSFGFERDENLRISDFSAEAELSASAAGKLKFGKEKSKSPSVSGYIGANGILSYKLSMKGKANGWNLLESLGVLYVSQATIGASRSLLIGKNALLKMLGNQDPSERLSRTTSLSAGWGFKGGGSVKGISLGKKIDLSFSGSLAADFDWSFYGEKRSPSGEILPYESMSGALAVSGEAEADFLKNITRRKWSTFARGGKDISSWKQKVEVTTKYKQTQEKTFAPDASTLKELALKDDLSFKNGLVAEGKFLDKMAKLSRSGFKLSFDSTIKFSSALKSKGAMAKFLASSPEAITEKIFPQIYNPTVAFESQKIYKILHDETTLSSGLREAMKRCTANYQLENLTFENKRSTGVEGEFEIPISKGSVWTLSITGNLGLKLEYPRQKSFFSTQDQRFFSTYYHPIRMEEYGVKGLDELGSWAESTFNLFKEIITPSRKQEMDRHASELCNKKEVLVGAGSVSTFTNTSRSYGPALCRYDLLRAAPQKDISHLTFTLPEQSLPTGAMVDFFYFYPAGDLLGVDGEKKEFLILSDFFTLKAREGESNIAETLRPFTLRCQVGRDDLSLVGFTSEADVHLYYTATDDGVWQDLGSIGADFTLSKLGTYALGAKMIYDIEAPKLSLTFDQKEKKLLLAVEENVALRDESWYCTINEERVIPQKIDNNTYLLPVSSELLKADSLFVFVEVTDLGGNCTQASATFHLEKDIPVISVEHSRVALYPSPVHSTLYIRGDEKTMMGEAILYNAQGERIGIYTLNGSENSIDVSFLPSGVYWLYIKGKNYSFIKQ